MQLPTKATSFFFFRLRLPKKLKTANTQQLLPNVHLVSHENIFSKGLDVLHDNKHLKKRHLGLFAANLVAAIRGRAKPRRSDPNQLFRSPSPSGSRSLHTTPLEDHASHVRAYSSQEKQLQPPSSRSPYASYSHVVKHGHNNSYHTYPPPTMAERMDSSASPPNDPELSKNLANTNRTWAYFWVGLS